MELHINGTSYQVHCDPSELLVWVLRDDLGLTGTNVGCGAGVCGSCTIHISGFPVRSCQTPVLAAIGLEITTIEGLTSILPDGSVCLHPLQEAFMEEHVPQCDWCVNGQIMTAAAYLTVNRYATEEEIDDSLASNYCRCGFYIPIRNAVKKAALKLQIENKPETSSTNK